MKYDAIIIGAGMSGLAAGIRLAMFDKRALILERHSIPGGLNSYYRRKGIPFDVGLHAMTNFVPKGTRRAPLTKLLKQLRIPYDDFQLVEQKKSAVSFPGRRLEFDNDPQRLTDSVKEVFPDQIDGFLKLLDFIRSFDNLDLSATPEPARKRIAEFIDDPVLIDMILCPILYYGSAIEDDIELGQFATMFQSIFLEGFARPYDGVRVVIDRLVKRYKDAGGEVRMRTGVSELVVENGAVKGVVTDAGEKTSADCVLSSAGLIETDRLVTDRDRISSPLTEETNTGRMTFIESISVLDCPPAELGIDTTIVFYNNADTFRYRPADGPADLDSGVICCPGNFQYGTSLPNEMIRVTNIAQYDAWNGIDEETYLLQKDKYFQLARTNAIQHVPDYSDHVTVTDMFTPRTIQKYTGHINGAVYGVPNKVKDGRTAYENLYIIGTDQGFLGIVGAILSGISMANLHVLRA